MAELPAICTVGHVSAVPNIIGGPGNIRQLVIRDVTTSCPRCGRPAKVIDGTYQMVNGVVSVLREAPVEKLREIQLVVASDAADTERSRSSRRCGPRSGHG